MKRLSQLILAFSLFLSEASAQITGGGFGGTASIPALLSEVLGISISNPTELVGLLATLGLMWLSTYIIFKIAIKKLDEGLDNRRNGFADAVGIASSDDRNILAVLTLLVTLSVIGTGAFYGLVSGWQSMILLAFTFMLIAGLLFILLGGTGLIFGGGSYIAGKSLGATSSGLDELKEHADELLEEEETLDELEENIGQEEKDIDRRERQGEGREDRSRDGRTERGNGRSTGADSTNGVGDPAEGSRSQGSKSSDEGISVEDEVMDVLGKLEKAFDILEDIEQKLSGDLTKESENIDRRIQHLEEMRRILERDEKPFKEIGRVIESLESRGLDSSSSTEELENVLENLDLHDELDEGVIREYISELETVEKDIREIKTELSILKEVEALLEQLREEVGTADKEEKTLEKLVNNLKDSEVKKKLIERLDRDKEELEDIEERFNALKNISVKIEKFFSYIEGLEEDLGGLEKILEELEKLRSMAQKIVEAGRESRKVDLLFFSPQHRNYIEKNTRFTLPGSREKLLVDLSLKMRPSVGESPGQVEEPYASLIADISRPLSDEFKKENLAIDVEGDVGQHRRLGRDERSVKWMMITVFKIVRNMQDLRGETGGIRLSSEVSKDGNKYGSELVNSIYLGALLENIDKVYSAVMKFEDSERTGRSLTLESVKKYSKSSEVKLSSYENAGGEEPIVLVEHESDTYGLLMRSGELVHDIDSEKVHGVFLIGN